VFATAPLVSGPGLTAPLCFSEVFLLLQCNGGRSRASQQPVGQLSTTENFFIEI
jgi:hypothetical protein